jgi:hypothetical protein
VIIIEQNFDGQWGTVKIVYGVGSNGVKYLFLYHAAAHQMSALMVDIKLSYRPRYKQ